MTLEIRDSDLAEVAFLALAAMLVLGAAAATPSEGIAVMCRKPHTLDHFEPPVTHEEIRASALRFVRKVTEAAKARALSAARYGSARVP